MNRGPVRFAATGAWQQPCRWPVRPGQHTGGAAHRRTSAAGGKPHRRRTARAAPPHRFAASVGPFDAAQVNDLFTRAWKRAPRADAPYPELVPVWRSFCRRRAAKTPNLDLAAQYHQLSDTPPEEQRAARAVLAMNELERAATVAYRQELASLSAVHGVDQHIVERYLRAARRQYLDDLHDLPSAARPAR